MVSSRNFKPIPIYEQAHELLVDGAQSVPARPAAVCTRWASGMLVAAAVMLAASVAGRGYRLRSRLQANVVYIEAGGEAWLDTVAKVENISSLVKGKVEEVHQTGVKVRAALRTWAEIKGHKYSDVMTKYLNKMSDAEVELALADSDFRGVLSFLSSTFGIAADQLEAAFANGIKNEPVSIKEPKSMLSKAVGSALEDFKPLQRKFDRLAKKFSEMANDTDVLLAQCDGIIQIVRQKKKNAQKVTLLKALGGCVEAATGAGGTMGVAAAGGAGAGGTAVLASTAAVLGTGPLAAAVALGGGAAALACAAVSITGAVESGKIADSLNGFVDRIKDTKRLFRDIETDCAGLAQSAHKDYDDLNNINARLKLEKWLISVSAVDMWRTTVVNETRKTAKIIDKVLAEGR